MTIQAVFFDMGGTIETYNTTREIRLNAVPGMQAMLVSAGIDLHLPDDQFLELFSAGMRRYHDWRLVSLEELPAGQILREHVFADYNIPVQVLESIAEGLMLYFGRCFYQRAMRPEVPAVLKNLHKMGLKVGLISNVSSRELVPAMLKSYGIYEFFNPIVLSCEYGRRKPDPSIFHYAARMANVPAGECAYVGDRISRDILGAARAGFQRAVQIVHDYDHGENDDGAVPDAVITDMSGLIGVLGLDTSAQDARALPSFHPVGKVKAILFDAGDILYYRPSVGKWLNPFLLEVTGQCKQVTPAKKSSLNALAFSGAIDQRQFRERMLALHGVTGPENIARGISLLIEEENDIEYFPGVRETLIALKKSGYYLGIVTDTAQPVHVKLKWFEKGGFGHVWDTIISSKEIGICKPDPKIYQAALHQLGLLPSQAAFIGHKKTELDGAHAVGMRTVAFNHEEGAVADCSIRNFSDLLDLPLLHES